MTTTTETESTVRAGVTRFATYGVLATVVAVAVNVLVRIIAVELLGVSTEFDPLAWGPVISTTAVAVLGAAGVYAFLARVSERPNRTFRRVALVVLLVSFAPLFAPPTFLAAAPLSVLGTLAAMHATTAGVVLLLLPQTLESSTRSAIARREVRG